MSFEEVEDPGGVGVRSVVKSEGDCPLYFATGDEDV
jgi:hypothetical protein